jgi:hypothetical protein
VKEYIVKGEWLCLDSLAIRLAAIQMQITYGDITKSKHRIEFLK